MSFSRLDGVAASVSVGGSSRSLVLLGDLERGAGGNLVDSRRQKRRSFRLELTHLPFEEARSLALLAVGYMHVWDFNDSFQASTSLGPTTAGHDAHLLPGDGWDGSAALVRAGGTLSYDPQLDDEWTVFLRFRDEISGGNPWRYAAITHDGREWLDGVEGVVGVANLVAVSAAGVVTITGRDRSGANADLVVDGLVVLPWRMADAHILDALAWEQPWGPAPEVHLQGDVIEAPLGIYAAGAAEGAEVFTMGSGRTSFRGSGLGPLPKAPYAIDDEFLTNVHKENLDLVETTAPASLDVLPLPQAYWPLASDFDTATITDLVAAVSATFAHTGFAAGPDGALGGASVQVNQAITDGAATANAPGTAGVLSVSAWFRPTSMIAQTLWSKWTESVAQRIWRVQMLATGEVVVQVSNGTGVDQETYTTVDPLLALGRFSFIAFDYNAARVAGARVRVFVDGSPRSTSVVLAGAFTQMNATGGSLRIAGQSNPATGLTGHIAHWACWQRALLTEEHRIAYLLAKRGHRLRRA